MRDAIKGLQWGDEGKGNVGDKFAPDYDVVARYQGGRNAGHTMVIGEKEIVLHGIPVGVLHSEVYNVNLAGVVFDPVGTLEEIDYLIGEGYPVTPENFGVSGRTQVTLGYHFDIEAANEIARGANAVKTTMKGIGPTSVDKYGKNGIRFAEFLNEDSFRRLLEERNELEKALNGKGNFINVSEYLKKYENVRERLAPFVVDEIEVFRNRVNEKWLFEGANGILLDPDLGTYPFATSTHPAYTPDDMDEVYGIIKAYITRVGAGPFPTQMSPRDEAKIRGEKGELGSEFGSTTGRPRSCGWLDLPMGRLAVEAAKATKLVVTKLDKLDDFEKIYVAEEYLLGERHLSLPPQDRFELDDVKPKYKTLDGWQEDISGIEKTSKLPDNARRYLDHLQAELATEISHVSVGPRSEQVLEVDSI